jgi:hypothetical protein
LTWLVPGFVTQDGPAHLYNAHILAESLRTGRAPFASIYEVHWEPLPNWAGHLILAALASVLPPRSADRIMMSVTLAAFGVSVAWLRWRVRVWDGFVPAALWSALLAMNVTWLLGFCSFLLGACLFAITLGTWWTRRIRLGVRDAAILAALLLAGYFCHPISLGWTVIGLIVLAASERSGGRIRRFAWTLASFVPLIPLGLVYRSLMRGGGALRPVWGTLGKDPSSLGIWKDQVAWVDPLTLGRKMSAPFLEGESPWYALLVPAFWFATAAVIFVVATARARRKIEPAFALYRGWGLLATLLLLGGLFAPDTLGPNHGNYLAQRTVLLGLVALLPALELAGPERRANSFATVLLCVAVVLQAAFVGDYARRSHALVREFLSARPHVGEGRRVGTLLLDLRGNYRANPLLHLDSLLGVGTGNIIWSNYESAFYYFPVRVRADAPHPPIRDFEAISMRDAPGEAETRAELWRDLIERYHDLIDVIVTWGQDPRIDVIQARWYRPVFQQGKVHVYRRRAGPGGLDRTAGPG